MLDVALVYEPGGGRRPVALALNKYHSSYSYRDFSSDKLIILSCLHVKARVHSNLQPPIVRVKSL